jgi:hypothetical protein
LTHEIQDVRQVHLHVGDTDFKFYSEANNLKEKYNYSIVIRERAEQEICRYTYANVTWTEM